MRSGPATSARLALGLMLGLFLAPLLPLVPWSLSRGWFWPALLPPLDGAAWQAVVDLDTG